jgi:hypothetical protein
VIAVHNAKQNKNVTGITAVATVQDKAATFDGNALLQSIDGEVVESTDTLVVMTGQFQGRDCRVTITFA